MRAPLFRYESTFTLVAARDPHGGWTVRTGSAEPRAPDRLATHGRDGPRRRIRRSGPISRTASTARHIGSPASRCCCRTDRWPNGPATTQAAVDSSVADAARLCAVGASIAPDWQPGGAGDEAAALVARVTALVGTIDEATVELVRLHLELGERSVPAESLALLAEAVAELGPGHQRGDQDDVRNNRDRH